MKPIFLLSFFFDSPHLFELGLFFYTPICLSCHVIDRTSKLSFLKYPIGRNVELSNWSRECHLLP